MFDPKFKFLKDNVIKIIKKKEIDLSHFFYPLSFPAAFSTFLSPREAPVQMKIRPVFHHMRLPAIRDECDV